MLGETVLTMDILTTGKIWCAYWEMFLPQSWIRISLLSLKLNEKRTKMWQKDLDDLKNQLHPARVWYWTPKDDPFLRGRKWFPAGQQIFLPIGLPGRFPHWVPEVTLSSHKRALIILDMTSCDSKLSPLEVQNLEMEVLLEKMLYYFILKLCLSCSFQDCTIHLNKESSSANA